MQKKPLSDLVWNLWCVASLVGIWPRFIEPRLLSTSRLTLPIPQLPSSLEGLSILQLSDLHLHPELADAFLDKVVHKVKQLAPDIIVFTGDFLCCSRLEQSERLKHFLCRFQAPYGCFAILGNHDYQQYVSIDAKGNYDTLQATSSPLKRGLERLMQPTPILTKHITDRARNVPMHTEFIALLQETPFQLLHNETALIRIGHDKINICGFGEYMLGRLDTRAAFSSYDSQWPGIILMHNPDGLRLIKEFPGEIVLCGHTHGGQVNLPGLYKKFMMAENLQFKRGLLRVDGRWAYVNRGLGSVMPFRWFAMPELLLLTLERAP